MDIIPPVIKPRLPCFFLIRKSTRVRELLFGLVFINKVFIQSV